MKKLFLSILTLGFLLSACEKLPPVKNQKYLKCVNFSGDPQYYLIQDNKLKKGDMYITTLKRYLDDATFKNPRGYNHQLMYVSDKYLVFDADWVSDKGTFAINRITLEAGPLYKFYEKSSGQRNDAYIEELFPSYLKSQCELTTPLKKLI